MEAHYYIRVSVKGDQAITAFITLELTDTNIHPTNTFIKDQMFVDSLPHFCAITGSRESPLIAS